MIHGQVFAPRLGESEEHFHGKLRVAQLLADRGFNEIEVEKEIPNQEVEIIGGNMMVTFWLDVYGLYDGKEIAIEVDGTNGGQGHLTKWARHKDHRRQEHLKEKKQVSITRFSTKDLIGKKALPDETILEQIFCDMAN